MTDAEPPHASTWPRIRQTCDRHMPNSLVCLFPWCRCEVNAMADKLQAELDGLELDREVANVGNPAKTCWKAMLSALSPNKGE